MKLSLETKITTAAAGAVALIIALSPFHAFLTIWLSSLVGHYTLLRLWKELLLVLLLAATAFVLVRDKQLWQSVRHTWLFRLIVLYVGLHVLLGMIAYARHQVNAEALGYALIVNLRLVLLFFVTYVLASKASWLGDYATRLLLVPAAIVVAFGLLQAFVLPVDVLKHVGYGPATILPYETVDHKVQYVRILSTLRGANPLGAYLVVILSSLVALLLALKGKAQKRFVYAVYTVTTLVVLYLTYSRSAYIGAFLSAVLLVWLSIRSARARRRLLFGGVVFCVVAGSLTLALRHNDRFENTFFHTDEHSTSAQSSNQARSSALERGVHDVLHEPLGRGPGTAGPASVHNDHPARIAENYYLQIGQELGLLGLFIFIVINVLVARLLWLRRNQPLAVALLASLLGISCINLLSHAWTDDTLAAVWWGLAGIVVASDDILKRKEFRHAEIQAKTRQA